MFVSEISLWGAAIVACVVIAAMITLAIVERKMLWRMLAIFGVTVAQMAVVGLIVWKVYQTFAWWSYLLCYLLVLVLSICWVLYPVQAIWKKLLWPVSVAMLASSILVGGSTLLCLPTSVFITVNSVLMACITVSMIQTMTTYQRNLHNPEANKQNLSESILPQVRTMAQPLVMVIPTLFVGMQLGGVSITNSLMVTLLLTAIAFVANVLAGVIALRLLGKKKH